MYIRIMQDLIIYEDKDILVANKPAGVPTQSSEKKKTTDLYTQLKEYLNNRDKKEVYLAIRLFILFGVLGLPVFADGACCMETMTGNSGGYIYGFFLAALILKSFFDQLKSSNSGKLLYILLYTLIVLLFGFIHLSFRIGMNSAFAYGILPFLPGAVAKILIAWSIIAIFESILSPKP